LRGSPLKFQLEHQRIGDAGTAHLDHARAALAHRPFEQNRPLVAARNDVFDLVPRRLLDCGKKAAFGAQFVLVSTREGDQASSTNQEPEISPSRGSSVPLRPFAQPLQVSPAVAALTWRALRPLAAIANRCQRT
jgi:hypothetical protein